MPAPRALSDAQVRRLRLRAQRLALPTAPGDEVAAAVVCVQAQDMRAAGLSLRARGRGLTAAGIDQARAEGALVRTWLMRGTLHLVAAADTAWLVALLG